MNAAVLDTWGERRQIDLSGGGFVVLKGIFQHEYVETSNINGYKPVLTCATSEIQEVSVGDTYVIDEVTYAIREPDPDSGGLTKLISERIA